MITLLKCEHCNKTFEVSKAIADAMTRWREQSGEPITCEACASTLDEIYETDNDPVGASFTRDLW